jgi:RNA polymerase sigma-70 factor (ECF subfamily)
MGIGGSTAKATEVEARPVAPGAATVPDDVTEVPPSVAAGEGDGAPAAAVAVEVAIDATTTNAFDELFRATYPTLVRALSVAADGEAAADAVQDAFVQANVHWRRVSQLDNPGAWVRRAAINRLANHRRGVRRRDAAVARIEAPAAVDLDPLDLDLAAGLRGLPDRQRLVLCLHYLADLSVLDIAADLGIAEGTVKSNLHDARNALRRRLGATDG